MPDIIGFEEVCFLLKGVDNAGAMVALSPNLTKESLAKDRKGDLFFYRPFSGFTLQCIESGELKHVSVPRGFDTFFDGIDNLCPLLFLKDIVYVPLRISSGEVVGAMQLINKQSGGITEDDINLAAILSQVIGNCLATANTAAKLSGTVDHVIESVQRATAGLDLGR